MSWLYLFANDKLEVTSYCITEEEMSKQDKNIATWYVSESVDISGLAMRVLWGTNNTRVVGMCIDRYKDIRTMKHVILVRGEHRLDFCTQNVKKAREWVIYHGGIHKVLELSLDNLVKLDLEQIQKTRIMVLFIRLDNKKLLGYTYDIARMYDYIDTFQNYKDYIASPIILQRFDGEDIYYNSNNSNGFDFARSPEAGKVKLELENELTPSHLARYKLLR